MEILKNISRRLPFINQAADALQISSDTACILLIGFLGFLALRLPFALFLSNAACLAMVGRSAILLLKSSKPKESDSRRTLITFVVHSLLNLLENISMHQLIPLYCVLKVVAITFILNSPHHSNLVYTNFLSKIPKEYLVVADDIEEAVKKAADQVQARLDSQSFNKDD